MVDSAQTARTGKAARGAKILVVATVHWASTTRLCLALAEGGLEVLVLAPDDHALQNCTHVSCRRLPRTHGAARQAVFATIARSRPDLVVPADEGALEILGALQARCGATDIANLIERSLGDQNAFRVASAKSQFVDMARRLGLPVPDTRVVGSKTQLEKELDQLALPLVLKLDGSFGGLGVRIVCTREEAVSGFGALQAAAGRLAAIKRSLRRLDVYPLQKLLMPPRSITLQAHVDGRPANRAVLCRDGKVLAGLSVEAVETVNATGPATVVRPLDHPGMNAAAECIVQRLRLSGFVGFDFVLEADTGRAVLLEMNLRPTQICHLALDPGSDMIGALAASLGVAAPARPLPNLTGDTVALFPQERWRDPRSPHLATAFHDVPWHAPEIVQAYSRPIAPEPPDWVTKLRALRAPAIGAISAEAVDV